MFCQENQIKELNLGANPLLSSPYCDRDVVINRDAKTPDENIPGEDEPDEDEPEGDDNMESEDDPLDEDEPYADESFEDEPN